MEGVIEMKIAYVIPTLNLGGAEKQQINILNGINTNKFKVKLFVLKNKTQLLSHLQNEKVDVEIFSIESISDIGALWDFVKSIRKYNPDIIHTQMYSADILIRCIKLFFLPKSKIIYHYHGLLGEIGKPKLYLDKITSSLVDKVIVVSQKSYDLRLLYEGYSREKMIVLHNSVSMSSSKKYNKSKKEGRHLVIGMASRLIPLKNIQGAIYMLSELIKKGFELNLVVAGDGPEKENLLQYASDLGIANKISFLGFVVEMESFYDKIDIFCISSIIEDLPLSVIEGMMHGKPILASNVGGIPEIVRDIPCTILVDDFFDSQDIDRVEEFLDFMVVDECRENLIEYALRNFDNQAYCLTLEKIYDELLENRNK